MIEHPPSPFPSAPILTFGALAVLLFCGCDSRTKENALPATDNRSSEFSSAAKPVDKLAVARVLAGYTGTYPVAEVFEGTHTRKSVKIAPDGSIDFDELIYLGKKDFTIAEDKRETNGCITVQLKGNQEGQIARLDVLFDAKSKTPVSMRYMPATPSPEGLVEIEFQRDV